MISAFTVELGDSAGIGPEHKEPELSEMSRQFCLKHHTKLLMSEI